MLHRHNFALQRIILLNRAFYNTYRLGHRLLDLILLPLSAIKSYLFDNYLHTDVYVGLKIAFICSHRLLVVLLFVSLFFSFCFCFGCVRTCVLTRSCPTFSTCPGRAVLWYTFKTIWLHALWIFPFCNHKSKTNLASTQTRYLKLRTEFCFKEFLRRLTTVRLWSLTNLNRHFKASFTFLNRLFDRICGSCCCCCCCLWSKVSFLPHSVF